jgi:glycosyltransferase involved in cell wall biosynthesis
MKDGTLAAAKILYDGWPLVYQPNSPAALHLLTLLAAHPAHSPAAVGLPGESFHRLPASVEILCDPMLNTDWDRLRWEQRHMPALSKRIRADRTHHVGSGPALFGSTPALVSPAGFPDDDFPSLRRSPGLTGRLREAFFQGGLARASTWLWPSDLPEPATDTQVHILPPSVHPLFQASPPNQVHLASAELEALNLPETYLLVHGPDDALSLRRLLDAWSWAAGSIGEHYPLILIGLDHPAQDRLAALLAEYQLTNTARPLPLLSLPDLVGVYRGCSALFHPAQISPWGDPARLAFACGKPVVGLESERAAALMGPAGYLTSPNQPYPEICRALGAALITVTVEESLAEELSQAAQKRSAPWQSDSFSQSLMDYYSACAS